MSNQRFWNQPNELHLYVVLVSFVVGDKMKNLAQHPAFVFFQLLTVSNLDLLC